MKSTPWIKAYERNNGFPVCRGLRGKAQIGKVHVGNAGPDGTCTARRATNRVPGQTQLGSVTNRCYAPCAETTTKTNVQSVKLTLPRPSSR